MNSELFESLNVTPAAWFLLRMSSPDRSLLPCDEIVPMKQKLIFFNLSSKSKNFSFHGIHGAPRSKRRS